MMWYTPIEYKYWTTYKEDAIAKIKRQPYY